MLTRDRHNHININQRFYEDVFVLCLWVDPNPELARNVRGDPFGGSDLHELTPVTKKKWIAEAW